MQVDIITHSTDLELPDFISYILKRRGAPFPEQVTVKMDGEPVTAYGWTDGVNSIVSIFHLKEPGTVKEVCLVTKWFEPPVITKWSE